MNKLIIEITNKCNLNCLHCGSSNIVDGKQLTTNEIKKILRVNKDKIDFVCFTGGEPTINKDINELIKYAYSYDYQTSIVTNGINKIETKYLNYYGVSIDGPNYIHNKIRNKNIYLDVMENIKTNLNKLCIVTTLTKYNINNLEELAFDLYNREIIPLQWQFQLGKPYNNLSIKECIEYGQMNLFWNFIQKYNNKFNFVLADCIGYYSDIESSKRIWNGCQAGKKVFGVLYDGSLTGCTSLREKKYIVGNIKDYNYKIREIIYEENKLKGGCNICKYKKYCNGGCKSLLESFKLKDNRFCLYNQSRR